MSFIAVIGSGPLGGAIAHRVASRDRIGEVRLIDEDERVAAGKALDIAQSAPVEGFGTRVTAAGSIAAAAGADAIVLADPAAGPGEHTGESGLALLRKLVRLETGSPILCAGASQRELIARGITELYLPQARILGSAPFALESALRSLAGLTIDVSGAEISLRIVGVPPRSVVVAWEEASAFAQPVAAHIAPHQIAALSARIPTLWPPGPYALASAASRIVEAIVNGSRRRFTCFVGLGRGIVAAMPAEVGSEGVRSVIEPSLTRLERTRLDTALQAARKA
jgi:malate dehydrogenase